MPYLLFLGDSIKKGIYELLNAWGKCKKKLHEVFLVIAGYGETKIKEIIEINKIKNVICRTLF